MDPMDRPSETDGETGSGSETPIASSRGDTDDSLAIETDGLRKVYGETVAVEGLDLTVPRGVVYAFLGPNGSGKTTTMRLLTTLTRPTAGSARVLGVDIANRNPIARRVGYLPEESPLFVELTGREMLTYVADLRDIPTHEADDRIATLLDRFGLSSRADDRIESYSKGMRQKLALVQSMLHDPELLVLDEPTAGLDPRATRTIEDVIVELADRGVTIFLSTHVLSVADELADIVGVLHDGRLVAEGDPASLERRGQRGDERSLEAAFLSVTGDENADGWNDGSGAKTGESTDSPGEG